MAKGDYNPSHETRFKPGESGNPNGRPEVPEDLQKARRLNKTILERTLNEFLFLTPDELKQRLNDPNTTTIELIVGKVVAIAISKGDEKRLGFLLDRLGFTVKTKISLDGGEDGSPVKLLGGKISEEDASERLKLLADAAQKAVTGKVE